MDSMDEDMFALSDEDLPIATPKCNPVEERLTKQLSDVQIRIEKAKSDINDVQDMIKRTLESLYSQARYGKDVTSSFDSDLYTIDGEPVVKKTKHRENSNPFESLVVENTWKRILPDKWVIGIELTNASMKILSNVQTYVALKGDDEFRGTSIIWKLINETLWNRCEMISSNGNVVATVVLDLPKFDKQPYCDVHGTVFYQVDEDQYQTPLPIVRLTIEDTIDSNYHVKIPIAENFEDFEQARNTLSAVPVILTLKSTSVEKIIDVQIEENSKREAQLMMFLEEKSFKEVCPNVYVAGGCLMHCIIEIVRLIEEEGKVTIRISARSSQQMNVILRLLRDQFPDVIIEENVTPLRAAMVLMEELKLYLGDASTAERQIARIRTDLFIP